MFVSGFATDVWIQRETALLQPSPENVLGCHSIALYTLSTNSNIRSTRAGASYRIEAYKTIAGWTELQLKFELRFTSPIMELLRSLLSLADFSQTASLEDREWAPEFSDDIHGLKIWLKDQHTGEGYLCEGCAVSECEITTQSRQIPTITFGIVALKATPLPVITNPGNLIFDKVTRPIILPELTGAYLSPGALPDPIDSALIPGATRATCRIARTLTPSRFVQGRATRFSKTPADFTGAVDCRIDSDLRSYLSQMERYGNMLVRFGQSNAEYLDVLMPSVGLTYGDAQLHSAQDTPTVTINVQAIQNLASSAGASLRAYRAPEGYDGGEFLDTDIFQRNGFDGGDLFDSQTSTIDGGTF